MKTPLQSLFWKTIILNFILVLTCSSCLEISEDIYINKDGSGKVTQLLNASEMMGLLSMFMPDSLNFTDSLNIHAAVGERVAALQNIEGISQVEEIISEKDFSFGFSFAFANRDALSKVGGILNDFNASQPNEKEGLVTTYKGNRHNICRTSTIVTNNMPINLENLDDLKGLSDFMSEPTYRVTYHLPKKVKKAKADKLATVAKDGNTVSYTYNFLDIITEKGKVMDHHVKY